MCSGYINVQYDIPRTCRRSIHLGQWWPLLCSTPLIHIMQMSTMKLLKVRLHKLLWNCHLTGIIATVVLFQAALDVYVTGHWTLYCDAVAVLLTTTWSVPLLNPNNPRTHSIIHAKVKWVLWLLIKASTWKRVYETYRALHDMGQLCGWTNRLWPVSHHELGTNILLLLREIV